MMQGKSMIMAASARGENVSGLYLPAAIVRCVFAEVDDLVGLDMVVVGVQVDVFQVNLVDRTDLLLNGVLLRVQRSIDGACRRLCCI